MVGNLHKHLYTGETCPNYIISPEFFFTSLMLGFGRVIDDKFSKMSNQIPFRNTITRHYYNRRRYIYVQFHLHWQ